MNIITEENLGKKNTKTINLLLLGFSTRFSCSPIFSVYGQIFKMIVVKVIKIKFAFVTL